MPANSCPFCYRNVQTRQILYVCSGRSAPGREPCPRTVNRRRATETGYQGGMRRVFSAAESTTGGMAKRVRSLMPPERAVCPDCDAVSGGRVCPHCHSPLPPDFAGSTSPLIAMVGAYGAGKTVYLSVLAQQLRTTLSERFQASVGLSGDAHGGESSMVDWLENNISAIFKDHRLFAATQRAGDGRREPVVFEWRKRGRIGARTSYLSFYDTAGEDLGGHETAKDLKYLASADALILLLDPFMLKAARDEAGIEDTLARRDDMLLSAVTAVTAALREGQGRTGRLVKIPVAATFPKIDAFFEQLGPDHPIRRVPTPGDYYDELAGAELHEHVRSLLAGWGGQQIDSHLRNNYADFRYFPVSALGEPPDYGRQTVSERGVRPLRVEEPLLWLLSKFGVVPSRKGPR